MLLFRKNLEEYITMDEDGSITVQGVFDVMVPKLYKRTELEGLFIKASSLTNWFLRSDGKFVVFNKNNINMKLHNK